MLSKTFQVYLNHIPPWHPTVITVTLRLEAFLSREDFTMSFALLTIKWADGDHGNSRKVEGGTDPRHVCLLPFPLESISSLVTLVTKEKTNTNKHRTWGTVAEALGRKDEIGFAGVGGEELLQGPTAAGQSAPGMQPPVWLRFSHLCYALQGGTKDSLRSATSWKNSLGEISRKEH